MIRWFNIALRMRVFVALAVPLLGLTIFWTCLEAYQEAGRHLTTASVHVRGYYRRDGTYVRSYNRRPPGGVPHDAPYERKRSLCQGGMFLGVTLSLVPLGLLLFKRQIAGFANPLAERADSLRMQSAASGSIVQIQQQAAQQWERAEEERIREEERHIPRRVLPHAQPRGDYPSQPTGGRARATEQECQNLEAKAAEQKRQVEAAERERQEALAKLHEMGTQLGLKAAKVKPSWAIASSSGVGPGSAATTASMESPNSCPPWRFCVPTSRATSLPTCQAIRWQSKANRWWRFSSFGTLPAFKMR